MYWDDSDQAPAERKALPVCDLAYAFSAREIPVDHALLLKETLCAELPWLERTPRSAIHLVHVAASGNGWYSPQDSEGSMLVLPRRSKLVLRVAAAALQEHLVPERLKLKLGRIAAELSQPKVRELFPVTSLQARYVVNRAAESEAQFLERVVGQLRARDVRCKKILCGRSHRLTLDSGEVVTRSLMLTGLAVEESAQLQTEGFGEHMLYGCGIFVPHKDMGV